MVQTSDTVRITITHKHAPTFTLQRSILPPSLLTLHLRSPLAITHGPFNEPPLLYFLSLPQGAITHKHHNKIHHMFHLSWPHGLSINNGIPDSEASTVYDMFRKAINDLIASGAGSLMVKLYLEQAFHQIPVCPEDWHLLGFTWAGKFYYNLVVCFGLCSAPYIFNLFAEALHWIIQHHIPAHIQHYLNDFLGIFSPEHSHDMVQNALAWMLALGRQLSLQFQPSKIDGPSTLIQYLGILLDSIKMEAHLPDTKLAFLHELLYTWKLWHTCSLHDLNELTGYLQFCSQVILTFRTFIRLCMTFLPHFNCYLLNDGSQNWSASTWTGGWILQSIGMAFLYQTCPRHHSYLYRCLRLKRHWGRVRRMMVFCPHFVPLMPSPHPSQGNVRHWRASRHALVKLREA